jgi:diguanylate cyclase (GGDEF)-like protein
VVVPFIIKDHPQGVLLADRTHSGRPIEEDEIPILTMFANQAGFAIENARLYTQIEELATTDGLTNLYNHRFFQESLRAELTRMERYPAHERILSLLMMDVDHFKNYNDAYGHQAGDQVLIEIGQILKGILRKTDIVARYGGEEFVTILPVTDREHAMMLAERLRKAVEEYPFEFGKDLPLKHVTISVGVSTYGEACGTPEQLIACADLGLYSAKNAGRNGVHFVRRDIQKELLEEPGTGPDTKD